MKSLLVLAGLSAFSAYALAFPCDPTKNKHAQVVVTCPPCDPVSCAPCVMVNGQTINATPVAGGSFTCTASSAPCVTVICDPHAGQSVRTLTIAPAAVGSGTSQGGASWSTGQGVAAATSTSSPCCVGAYALSANGSNGGQPVIAQSLDTAPAPAAGVIVQQDGDDSQQLQRLSEHARASRSSGGEHTHSATLETSEDWREQVRQALEEARTATREAQEEARQAIREAMESAKEALSDARASGDMNAQAAQERAYVEAQKSFENALSEHKNAFSAQSDELAQEMKNLDWNEIGKATDAANQEVANAFNGFDWSSIPQTIEQDSESMDEDVAPENAEEQAEAMAESETRAGAIDTAPRARAGKKQKSDLEERVRHLEALIRAQGHDVGSGGSLEDRVAALEQALGAKQRRATAEARVERPKARAWAITPDAPRVLRLQPGETWQLGPDAKKRLEGAMKLAPGTYYLGTPGKGFTLHDTGRGSAATGPVPPTPPAPPQAGVLAVPRTPPGSESTPTPPGARADRAEIERMMQGLREQAEALRAEMGRLREQIENLPRNNTR